MSPRTNLTLVLAEQNEELADARDELYPERVTEHIPLSITVLYPWIPLDRLLPASFVASEVTLMEEVDADVWRVRERLPLGKTRS